MRHSTKLLFMLTVLFTYISCSKDDGGGSTTPDITVNASNFTATIDENPSAGQVLGSITASTNSGSLSYTLTSDSPSGALAVSNTGSVSVADASLFDFESNPTITGAVTVANGSVQQNITITITLNDVNEVSVMADDFTTTIDENPAQDQSLGTIAASTSMGTVTYTISTQAPMGALAVSSTGELTVADPAAFDFETNTSVTATVQVANGTVTATSNVTVNLNDVQVIWSGATMSFSKADGADWTVEANQDRITDDVWITRDNNGGQIFNVAVETSDNKATSPVGTAWALGTTNDINSLTFGNFRSIGSPKNNVGKDLVLRIDEGEIYINLKFTSWSTMKAGGFAYDRSTQN